jgi:hypothetical protein
MRCAYCNHKLDVAGDAETRAVRVRRTPPARGTDSTIVTACWLCAQAKGLLTDAEYRKTLGFPSQRRQWLTLLHDAHRGAA